MPPLPEKRHVPRLAGMPRREPRRAATGLMLSSLALALSLAWVVSAWFLVAVPFALGGAYAMWVGLSNEEALDALGTWDDSGGGPAGMSM